METMGFLVWMLPVIFMLHDFEEIIMAEVWDKRFHERIMEKFPKRRPFGLGVNYAWQTPTLSIAVAIEFVLFSLVSLLSVACQSYFLWFCAYLGLLLHMVFIHILASLWFKGYVPGVVTSAILLVPGIFYLMKAQSILKFDAPTLMLAGGIGIALLAVILPALHAFMGVTDRWLDRYSRPSATR
ncbi:hypothetical protein hrd7_12260 [Leptolinea sp. HRD-7]|nr:hypothetical protein hrd7_12260 [Leptolinea sp. HRD-7]